MSAWLARLLALAWCVAAGLGRADAWEFEDAVPLPRAALGARPNQVSLQHVALSVRGTALSLRYEWHNEGGAADADLAIYLPTFDWQGAAAEYADRHFPELAVHQDGRALQLHRTTRAFHGGRDIMPLLRRGGINPLLVADNDVLSMPASVASRRAWRQLARAGAAHDVEGQYMPDWFVQSTPFWRMHWPARQGSAMTLSHKARPAFAPWETSETQLDALLRAHCSSAAQLKADFASHHWPWPDYVVAQRFDIPLGVQGWHVDVVDLDFDPGHEWSGLPPRVSYVCQRTGEPVTGLPAIKVPRLPVRDDHLSILLILPQ